MSWKFVKERLESSQKDHIFVIGYIDPKLNLSLFTSLYIEMNSNYYTLFFVFQNLLSILIRYQNRRNMNLKAITIIDHHNRPWFLYHVVHNDSEFPSFFLDVYRFLSKSTFESLSHDNLSFLQWRNILIHAVFKDRRNWYCSRNRLPIRYFSIVGNRVRNTFFSILLLKKVLQSWRRLNKKFALNRR